MLRNSLLLLTIFIGSMAQDPRGAILGRVSDASGSPLAGATVQVTNPATGLKVTVTSSETGDYRAPYLNPGT
ncbi:MAG: carboxypeptidase-like regulatory domain-containing protein [Acidobacteriota bacterium]|jgi:hypothetical protein